ncbi:kinase [Amylibacter marinus]|uniref:Kinase n=1 Tax=Amylibacter marinus TaxID=1475483 RepID=A0ABQ5VU29_9RHOB|nr:PfkB family carbohydrate kinase [Amylibacter marinus]GLQ34940.1 kinase [Amylibacter marinus]
MTASKTIDILCIGSVLWDIIGRAPQVMNVGTDVGGRITRIPGGVAMNIAMTAQRFGLRPALLTAIGDDAEGADLLRACTDMGMITDHVHRSEGMPTDRYMAIEGSNGLVAAIADAHTLEAADSDILRPLSDGRLGSEAAPYDGVIALDGNLTTSLLSEIANSPLFARADMRLAPASPGKAQRLLPLLKHAGATLYVNLEEAGLLCDTPFDTAFDAAAALVARGAHRVLVTNGARAASLASAANHITATPPQVAQRRVTGAGDTFMAAHIAAEINNIPAQEALEQALATAAKYVSGEDE